MQPYATKMRRTEVSKRRNIFQNSLVTQLSSVCIALNVYPLTALSFWVSLKNTWRRAAQTKKLVVQYQPPKASAHKQYRLVGKTKRRTGTPRAPLRASDNVLRQVPSDQNFVHPLLESYHMPFRNSGKFVLSPHSDRFVLDMRWHQNVDFC